MLTYALLEALHQKDGSAGDQSVRVLALANAVSARVPAITQELFGEKQSPVLKLLGDFPLGIRQPVLGPFFETRPAAVLRAIPARKAPAEDAPIMQSLEAGDQVRIRGAEGSWSLIERNGVEIGYVPTDALLPLKGN